MTFALIKQKHNYSLQQTLSLYLHCPSLSLSLSPLICSIETREKKRGKKKKKMAMAMAFALLALLFIAGLIYTLFSFPNKNKFTVCLQSLFTKTTSNITSKHVPVEAELKAAKDSSNTRNKAELKSVFATFDKNNDGFITKQELKVSFKNIGMHLTEGEVADLVEKVDSNGDGLIDLDEFCGLFEAVAPSKEAVGGEGGGEEDDLKEAFDVFDGDRDGLISVEELGSVLSCLGLKEGQRLEKCREMIRRVDVDGDGMVNFDEFKRMMRSGGNLIAVS